jgi:2-keto-4-pentenoate hydratase/2-oxohepta-3-ene-1,7-dioic acid hydratase in catechol pathway
MASTRSPVLYDRCKNVSREDALNYVAGYCVAHDVSERGWQLDSSVNG